MATALYRSGAMVASAALTNWQAIGEAGGASTNDDYAGLFDNPVPFLSGPARPTSLRAATMRPAGTVSRRGRSQCTFGCLPLQRR